MAQSTLTIGAFQTDREAKNAIDTLMKAGFAHDQLGFAWRDSGVAVNNYLNDLMNLGVPQDQASYYDNEFKAGHPVVSVRPDGREQEAMNILRSNGAYTYDMQRSGYGQQTAPGTAGQYGPGYGTDEERRRELQEEPQGFNIPATREEVEVERRPASEQGADTRTNEQGS